MAVLQNSRREAFVLARAKGASLEQAYEDAGFVADKSHACRLANRPEVAERIAELRREQDEAADASPQAIIAAMVQMARDSEAAKTPAGAKEARANLLEAYRLSGELAASRECDRRSMRGLWP